MAFILRKFHILVDTDDVSKVLTPGVFGSEATGLTRSDRGNDRGHIWPQGSAEITAMVSSHSTVTSCRHCKKFRIYRGQG